MTDTPNTSRQSEAIQRYITLGGPGDMDPHEEGDYVRHRDHLAALARAREEARREALQDAKFAAEATGRVVTDGLARLGRYEQGYARARADIEYAIHSLLTPTPQRESRVDQKRPPHPEELVNALQDRVHPASGPLIQSKPVTPQGETKEPRGFAGIPFIVDPAVPPGEAQFVDPVDGRVIGRITGAAGGMEQP